MKKTLSFVLAFSMVLAMFTGIFSLGASAVALEVNAPEVTVYLIPGETATERVEVDYTLVEKADSYNRYSASMREVVATASAIEVTSIVTASNVESVRPALKFDRNSTADQKVQKANRELYTDNGHFDDPSAITVTDAPEGYPFKYVGFGDYSGHYVSHVRVIYKRDAAGNAIKDANGNYVIDHLEHSGGTPLNYNGELTTSIQGPFHFATGTRPQQFLLKNEEGNVLYGYCVDIDTGAEEGKWYAIANLEDNDYYASEEAENHIRNIVENGYWGTESGIGSLDSIKETLKAAVSTGKVKSEYDVYFVNRAKYADFIKKNELVEGVHFHHGNYVYWDLVPVNGENHVILTDDVIDGLTEGEALDAMQMAIWSFANGAMCALDGIDGMVIGDPYVASSQISDSLHGKNDWAGAARTRALYEYLIGLDDPKESTVVINDKTFAENISLTIGREIAEGIYEAEMNFALMAEFNEKDDLSVTLTYVDANGETQTITADLTGEEALVSENGIYTLEGLMLRAGEEFNFSLNIMGEQYLEQSAYILTSEGGINASQTFVTLASGMNSVDVTKSANIVFNVSENVVYKNKYLEPVKATINGKKYLDGKLADGFTFILEDSNGNVVDTARSENGEFEFRVELDSTGNHVFYVYELNENVDGIIYDDNVFEVRFKVTRGENRFYVSRRLMGASAITFYNTTVPETTEPEETTVAPEETTVAPEETTEAPEETTEVPEETTEAPEETTAAPEETTAAPEVTTEPEEEITEEPTPLDPTPETTEAPEETTETPEETTEPEEEITEPEIPLAPNPETGDSSLIIAVIAIASIALAVLHIKRRQVIED